VLLDFGYLKTPALFEHRIENNADLIARDGEIWEVHGSIVCRVYDLFDSIYKYIKDFVRCIADLRDGIYIQQTVDGVLLDEDGKQVMCESLYLYGVMLLLLDQKIDGAVRERIVVAYYRHKGQSAIESIEDMALLVGRTGYNTSTLDRNGMLRRPPGYPEDYLRRLPRKLGMPSQLVLMMIDRLRSEDMYSQIPSYPLPQHRSTALATQARLLSVILYFAPEVRFAPPPLPSSAPLPSARGALPSAQTCICPAPFLTPRQSFFDAHTSSSTSLSHVCFLPHLDRS
jgi:WASH complex subunit strumpellin